MKKRDWLLNVVIFVSALVLVFVCVSLIGTWISGLQAEKVRQDAADLYYQRSFWDGWMTSACAETVSTGDESPELPPIHGDFQKLYERNPHVIGWLKAGADIDYPVTQYDNEFYISHNFNGEPDKNGTLFVNTWCSVYPRDDVVMIHGHNMKSTAMFGKLDKFERFSYVCQYPVVTFRTVYDEEDVYYTPIAAFEVSTMRSERRYFDILRFAFEDDAEPLPDATTVRQSKAYQEYLNEIAARSLWQPLTDVTVDDALLAMVTCSYNDPEGRLVVFCRALRDGETPDEIYALYQAAE